MSGRTGAKKKFKRTKPCERHGQKSRASPGTKKESYFGISAVIIID